MGGKATALAPVVLRFGMTALFLWFGLSQVTNPVGWTSWLPQWTSTLPLAPQMIVLLNGGFETVFGILLGVGFFTRWVALLLALHLFLIAYEIGYNDIGVRDFCLAIATVAVALYGSDIYTFDHMRAKSPQISNSV
jgi:uncharacterized membrane protein YphA (DoxX/SURF4 family)